MGNKKQAPYVIFAKANRKKYEVNGKLSVPELVNLASADWNSLPPDEKERWKDIAKDMRSRQPSEPSFSFKNETSNHRLDTEGETISTVET